MSVAGTIGAVAGGISALTGIGGLIQSGRNFGLSAENQQWLRQMQERAWLREDSAVQRRAADLEAAGLSKTLAAGSGAASSSPIKIQAPQREPTGLDQIAKSPLVLMDVMRMKADIDRTRKQNQLIDTQIDQNKIRNQFMSEMNPLKIQQQEIKNYVQKMTKTHQISISAYQAKKHISSG